MTRLTAIGLFAICAWMLANDLLAGRAFVIMNILFSLAVAVTIMGLQIFVRRKNEMFFFVGVVITAAITATILSMNRDVVKTDAIALSFLGASIFASKRGIAQPGG